MNRKEIHENITMLLGKIHYLNEKLANQNEIHPVEFDLFDGYISELAKLRAQLNDLEELNKVEQSLLEDEEETQEQLQEVIKEEAVLQPEPPKAAEIAEETVIEEVEAAKPELEPELEEAETADSSGEVEEEKITAQVEEETPVPEPGETVINDKDEISLNDRFKKQEVAVGDKLAAGTASKKSLKDRFDLNQRYQFIEELFDGKPDEFIATLNKLESCNSRTEIESLFDEHYERYNWSEKVKIAESLKKSALNYVQN